MAQLTHDQIVLLLQDWLTFKHADMRCFDGMCPHDEPVPVLPRGVHAVVGHDFTPRLDVVILIRYANRGLGGWEVLRADNRRPLGWTHREQLGEHKGRWSAHVSSSAFQGDGPNDTGHTLDRVPPALHFSPDGSSLSSRSIGHYEQRFWAAYSIVNHLVHEHAPAVGYPAHPRVTPHHQRPEQHFDLNGGLCSCTQPLPCRKRAALLERTAS